MIQFWKPKLVKCVSCRRKLRRITEGKRFVCWRCTDRVVAARDVVKLEMLPYSEQDPFSLNPTDSSVIIEEVRKGEMEIVEKSILDGKTVMIIGGLGTGKTTLCERVYNKLRDLLKAGMSNVAPVFLHAAAYTTMQDYIQGIARELRLPTPSGKDELVGTLVDWPKMHQERLALIVDDVTEGGNWLEVGGFLRVASDVQGISIVLNGNPEDMRRFMRMNSSLQDRTQTTIRLNPLGPSEIRAMLVARAMKVLGEMERRLISEKAYDEIAKRSKGNPRYALKIASKAYQLAVELNSPLDRDIVKMEKGL